MTVGFAPAPGVQPGNKPEPSNAPPSVDAILAEAQELRWQIGGDFHQALMEAIYTDAAAIADRAVTRPGEKPRFDLDRTIDRLVTSRVWGFPLMLMMFTGVFWITITGANVPSRLLADLLIKLHYEEGLLVQHFAGGVK